MTPDAIRRKNFIAPKAMPYTTATGKIYDSGDFTAHMKRAMEIAEWREFPRRAKAAKKQAWCAASGLRPMSRSAAPWARKPPMCGSTPMAMCRS